MNAIRSLAGAAVLAAGSLFAAEPAHELTRDGAVKLIKELIEDYQERIEIALILDGKSKEGPFEFSHARRVIAIHPVPEEGRRIRRMVCYDFFWSDDYGWFTWEKRVERGGDAVYIWSESKGEVIVK